MILRTLWKITLPTENLITFQDLLSVMGAHRSRLTITPEEFSAILCDLHARFGTDFQNAQHAYTKLRLHLRGIGGDYRSETAKIDKKSFVRKLQQALAASRKTNNLLREFSGGIGHWENPPLLTQPLSYGEIFIQAVPQSCQFGQDLQMHDVEEELQATIDQLELICAYFEAVLVGFEHIPAKRGQRGLRWYDHFVESLIEVAGVLGILVSTDARGLVQDGTVFTAFVFALEKLLPPRARSPSAAACAKRIERSLLSLRRSGHVLPSSVA